MLGRPLMLAVNLASAQRQCTLCHRAASSDAQMQSKTTALSGMTGQHVPGALHCWFEDARRYAGDFVRWAEIEPVSQCPARTFCFYVA